LESLPAYGLPGDITWLLSINTGKFRKKYLQVGFLLLTLNHFAALLHDYITASRVAVGALSGKDMPIQLLVVKSSSKEFSNLEVLKQLLQPQCHLSFIA
jgi:hypothetical protein